MATTSSEVRHEFVCQICLEWSFPPGRGFRLFPCQHYADARCVEELQQRSNNGRTFECPWDRQPVPFNPPLYRQANNTMEEEKHREEERKREQRRQQEQRQTQQRQQLTPLTPTGNLLVMPESLVPSAELVNGGQTLATSGTRNTRRIEPAPAANPQNQRSSTVNRQNQHSSTVNRQNQRSSTVNRPTYYEVLTDWKIRMDSLDNVEREERCSSRCHPASKSCSKAWRNLKRPQIRNRVFNSSNRVLTILVMLLTIPYWLMMWMTGTMAGCVGIFSNDPKLRKPSILKAAVLRKRAFDLVRKRILYQAFHKRLMILGICTFLLLWVVFGVVWFSALHLLRTYYDSPIISASLGIAVTGWCVSAFVTVPMCVFLCEEDDNFNNAKLITTLKVLNAMAEIAMLVLLSLNLIQSPAKIGQITANVVLCGVCVMWLWISQLVIIVGLKRALKGVFASLLFVVIGNHAITALLCVAVWYMGTDLYDKTDEYQDMSQHINETLYVMTLCIIIGSNSLLNIPMYFIGYLYEVTELSALLLTDCDDRDDEHNFVYSNQAKLLINNLVSLHPFHKTLFPLVFARYGWVTYFWIFPSLFLFFAAYDKTSVALAIAHFFINAFVNHRMFMLAIMTHVTLLWLVLNVVFFIVIVGFVTVVLYTCFGLPFALIMLIMLIKDWCNE